MRMTHHSSSALYEHTQDILEDGRHDVTGLMHHEDVTDSAAAAGGGLAPVASAVAQAVVDKAKGARLL
jgi:hypothetical protein